jgi:hypothetical protein
LLSPIEEGTRHRRIKRRVLGFFEQVWADSHPSSNEIDYGGQAPVSPCDLCEQRFGEGAVITKRKSKIKNKKAKVQSKNKRRQCGKF